MPVSTPTPATLRDPRRYECVERLSHAQIVAAIRPHLRRRSAVTVSYWALNLLALLWVIVVWHRSGMGLARGFPIVCVGMVGAYLLLLPVHEALHALTYRLLGARRVTVYYAWRRLTAHCMADQQVLGRTRFAVVCLAPLVVLNALLLIGTLLVPAGAWSLALAGAILLHTGAASGDVALVNLLWRERGAPQVWTYDDVRSGESYFFRALTKAE